MLKLFKASFKILRLILGFVSFVGITVNSTLFPIVNPMSPTSSKGTKGHFNKFQFITNNFSEHEPELEPPNSVRRKLLQNAVSVVVTVDDVNPAINQSQIQANLPANIVIASYEEVIVSAQGSCPVGYYCPPDTTIPTACPVGTYNNFTNRVALVDCIACPAGQFCPIHSVLPINCAAGSYRGSTGGVDQSSCTVCPAGNFCPIASINPTNCTGGSYRGSTEGVSQNNCTTCPTGNYCPIASINPTNCTSGSYRGSTGGVSQSSCTTCPTGNYCPIASVDPTNCSAGTYNPVTNQGSVVSCLACPAGDYCPIATTTPPLCFANTFTATTGAAICDNCPVFSTSPIASTNCTCDAGHNHVWTAKGGGTASLPIVKNEYIYDNIVQDGHYSLQYNGSYHVSVTKGSVVTFSSPLFYDGTANVAVPLKIFSNLYLPGGISVYDSDLNLAWTGPQFTDLIPLSTSMKHATQTSYTYIVGVTGSGTTTLIWDTANVPSNIYYLGTQMTVYESTLTVFVASTVPTTITYAPTYSAYFYILTAACIGDTLILNKPTGITGPVYDIFVACIPRYQDSATPTITVMASGPSPLTWLVAGIDNTLQCMVFYGDPVVNWNPYSLIAIYPRPTGTLSLNCANCSSGYRSSPGDSVCTMCGLGYYSNPVSRTCTVCPVGTKCPNTTTAAPVNCGVGYYQSQTTQSSCILCPLGQYCNLSATVTPVSCPAGTYRGSTGAARVEDCSRCPTANYCPIGSIDPTNCTAGTYNPSTGQPSPASCLACPAGDYCPTATTTPSLCIANTFTATTGAAVCGKCPSFSTSPVASTNCTCDAGHYHNLISITSSSVMLTVAGADTYLAATYPGNTKFTSLGAGLLSYPQIDDSINVLLVKGGIYSFNAGMYGASTFGLNIYSGLSGMDVTYLSYRDVNGVTKGTNYFLGYAIFTTSVSDSATYLYSTGVTGQGSTSVGLDTSSVPSGVYYLMSDVGQNSKRYAIDVFVASLTPVTLNYQILEFGVIVISACLGDTINFYLGDFAYDGGFYCQSDPTVSASLLLIYNYGDAYMTWTVNRGVGVDRCFVYLWIPSTGASWAIRAILKIYPRPSAAPSGTTTSALACSNCSSGYRSNPGAPTCTECGLGYYSNPVSQTCTVCPTGTKCPNATTAAPVNCGVGFYQSQTTQSICLVCPVGKYCDLNTTATPISCPAGTYRGSTGAAKIGDCSTCTTGNYCPINSVDPTNCTAGTYNPSTGKPDSTYCLACPAGDYCPTATTTPPVCAVNTFTAKTGAAVCDQCPAFSTSRNASTNCTCDAGYYHQVISPGDPVVMPVSGADTYSALIYPGNPRFVSLGSGLLSYPQIGNLMSVLIVKGGKYSLRSGTYGGSSFGLKLYSQLSGVDVTVLWQSDVDNSFMAEYPLERATFTTSVSNSATYLYSVGVTGQGTSTLSWDTATVPSGLYFLMTDVGQDAKRYAVDVFVASATPVTLNYQLLVDYMVPITACIGDTVVMSFGPALHGYFFFINCASDLTFADYTQDLLTVDAALTWVSWVVTKGVVGQCHVSALDPVNWGSKIYSVLKIYPRPSAIASEPYLNCPNCPSGYRSSPGAQSCTECGLGYFQNKSTQSTCMLCPTGRYCNSTTTVTPVSCPAGTYRSTTGASSVSDCMSCPAGDYCPVATATPPLCAFNTFTAATGAAVCDNCPTFSTSDMGSINCTCDAGHYHMTMTVNKGKQTFSLMRNDTIYNNRWPAANKYMTTSDMKLHLTVAKGSTVTFNSQPYSSSNTLVPLNIFTKLYQTTTGSYSYTIAKADVNPTWTGKQIIDAIPCPNDITHATQTLYINNIGVTGAGTDSLVWDTTDIPSNVYFVGTRMIAKDTPISVFVASPIPTTITYTPYYWSSGYISLAAACIGDTVILYKPTGATVFTSSTKDVVVSCFQNSDVAATPTITVKASGPSPLTWVVSGIDDTMQCFVTYGPFQTSPFFIFDYYSWFIVYPRPTGVPILNCANCSSGYRSNPGAPTCTECGLGYYSNPVSQTCTVCPVGTKCPNTTTPVPVDCGVGFYQSQTTQSTCLVCPVGQYCNLSATVTPVDCPAGSYRSTTGAQSQAQCSICTIGHYCPIKSVTPTDCVSGTYNPSTTKGALSDCLVCTAGKYSMSIASSTDCPLCQVNYYCPNSTTINSCPINTVSVAGKSSLLDCRCKPGFSCTYTKRITAIITLNSSTTSFNNDVGGVKTAFIAAVAAAAGVPISSVHIGTVSSTAGGRRLLSSESFSGSIHVHATVMGATRLNNLGVHLAKHNPNLHIGHSWQEAHHISSTSSVRIPLHSTRR